MGRVTFDLNQDTAGHNAQADLGSLNDIRLHTAALANILSSKKKIDFFDGLFCLIFDPNFETSIFFPVVENKEIHLLANFQIFS